MSRDRYRARLKAAAAGRSIQAIQEGLAERLIGEGEDRERIRRVESHVLSPGILLAEARDLLAEFDDHLRHPFLITQEAGEAPMGVAVFWFPPEIHDQVRELLRQTYIDCLHLAIEWAAAQPGQSDPEGKHPETWPRPNPWSAPTEVVARCDHGEIKSISEGESVDGNSQSPAAVSSGDQPEADRECGSPQPAASQGQGDAAPGADQGQGQREAAGADHIAAEQAAKSPPADRGMESEVATESQTKPT